MNLPVPRDALEQLPSGEGLTFQALLVDVDQVAVGQDLPGLLEVLQAVPIIGYKTRHVPPRQHLPKVQGLVVEHSAEFGAPLFVIWIFVELRQPVDGPASGS